MIWTRRYFPRLLIGLVLFASLMLSGSTPTQAEGNPYHLPPGFVRETVVSGLKLPTGFALSPDGRIFITEKNGTVRVVQNGQLLSTPFLDLSGKVNTVGDRGLLHVAVHPRFPATPYVYLAYVYEPPELAGTNGARVSRVVRVEADRANLNVARPETEVVILGANGNAATIGNPAKLDTPPYTCYDAVMNPVQDCVPNEGSVHSMGSLGFGPDGALYVGSGDGINYGWGSLRAQNLNVLAGKILRINPLNGQGYPNNPFYNGDLNSNVSKVFALGMKNPWRFGFHPVTGELFGTDVGNAKWEEINRIPPGANLGWPCFEGEVPNAFDPECQPVLSGSWPMTPPYFAYKHEKGRGAALGGDFIRAGNFPAGYVNQFFYSEFNVATIERLLVDDDGTVMTESFGSGFTGPVQLSSAPDGSLYLLSITEGALFRVSYRGEENGPPTAVATASPSSGRPPLRVQFKGGKSYDPNNDPLLFRWEFGDGKKSSAADPSHIYSEPGQYTVTFTVTDTSNESSTQEIVINVGNEAPSVEISAPTAANRFAIGETIAFRGKASDAEDGELGSDSLRWEGVLHHAEHIHYDYVKAEGSEGTFTFEDHGDNTYIELCLIATDAGNLQGRACVDVRHARSSIPLHRSPAGLRSPMGAAPTRRRLRCRPMPTPSAAWARRPRRAEPPSKAGRTAARLRTRSRLARRIPL